MVARGAPDPPGTKIVHIPRGLGGKLQERLIAAINLNSADEIIHRGAESTKKGPWVGSEAKRFFTAQVKLDLFPDSSLCALCLGGSNGVL